MDEVFFMDTYRQFAESTKQIDISHIAKLCNDGIYTLCETVIDNAKPYNNKTTAEYLLQYTYFCHVPLALYTYLSQPSFQLIWLLDIIGIITLSINSYFMHNALYMHYLENPDSMPSFFHSEIKYKYLRDVASIHFRSFLFLASNALLYGFHTPILLSLMLHCITFAGFCYYIDNNKDDYNINETVKILIKIPVIFDIIAITFFASRSMNSNFVLIHNVICVFLLTIVLIYYPFDKLNHIVVHLLLFYQTVILLQANTLPFIHPELFVNIHDYDMSLISRWVNNILFFLFR